MARTQVSDLLDACVRGDAWHNSMVRLVAHLAATGRGTAEILALAEHITLPGYTADQTRQDMHKALQGARAKWDLPEPESSDVIDPDAHPKVFPTLSLDEIENLPPPTYLIDDLVPEHGLTFVYGDPGAGKSFIVLDAALRLAYGMDWHGTPTKPTGVLYIAGEGKHGLGKRVKGWRREHGLEGADAPFKLLPVAVHMLDKESVQTLRNTIQAMSREVGFKVGLVVIDTVSRAIPGQDENKQDTMSLFVDGCAALHEFIDGALIGVHHSGKDSERGMRGSSVLLGAAEATIKVSKAGEIVTLLNEKQKDDEAAAQIYMDMKKVEWCQGLAKPLSTLVPFRTDMRPVAKETLSPEQVEKAFNLLAAAWAAGKPLSTASQVRNQGRYAPSIIAKAVGAPEKVVVEYLAAWLETDALSIEEVDRHTKAKGIRVLDPIVRGR